jgi:hypothetical protein
MSLTAQPVSVSDLLQLQSGIEFVQNTLEANAEALSISAGVDTVSAYANRLIADSLPLSQAALAVYSTMYNSTPSLAELGSILTNAFLPPQEQFATAHGFNPTVFDAEAVGLALSMGNNPAIATPFATNYGGLSITAFADAASTAIFGSSKYTLDSDCSVGS